MDSFKILKQPPEKKILQKPYSELLKVLVMTTSEFLGLSLSKLNTGYTGYIQSGNIVDQMSLLPHVLQQPLQQLLELNQS